MAQALDAPTRGTAAALPPSAGPVLVRNAAWAQIETREVGRFGAPPARAFSASSAAFIASARSRLCDGHKVNWLGPLLERSGWTEDEWVDARSAQPFQALSACGMESSSLRHG